MVPMGNGTGTTTADRVRDVFSRKPKDSFLRNTAPISFHQNGQHHPYVPNGPQQNFVFSPPAFRVGITGMCVCNLKLCMPIAIRYSAVRRQFGPKDTEEIPVIEYQLQQWRLIPYLAATYVLEHFADSFFMDYASLRISIMVGDKSQRSAELGKEIHALSCASKPLAGWIARDGIQECREACGGHGYFADSVQNQHTLRQRDNNVIKEWFLYGCDRERGGKKRGKKNENS
ncbi:peroxisomal acyl-coenzyme A oxidase 3-like [Crassostrea virginica]